MGLDYFSTEFDSGGKGEDLSKKVCAEFGSSASKDKVLDPHGSTGYKINNKMQDGRNLNVYFLPKVSSLQGISDKMIVWSYITPVDSIPLDKKENVLMRLLAINIESDTCAVGVNKSNYIMVKAERVLAGLDQRELKEMIKATFSVAQKLHMDVFPEYNIKTVLEE